MFRIMIYAILLILVAGFVLKLIKGLIKAFILGVLLMLLVFGLGSFVACKDISRMEKNFLAEDQLIVIEHENSGILACATTNSSCSKVSPSEADDPERGYKGAYIFEQESFRSLIPDEVEIEGERFSKEEVLSREDAALVHEALRTLKEKGRFLEIVRLYKEDKADIYPKTFGLYIADKLPLFIVSLACSR